MMIAPVANPEPQRQQAASYPRARQGIPLRTEKDENHRRFASLLADGKGAAAFDRLTFSPELKENLQYVRAQFIVNLEVVCALVSENEGKMAQVNLSLQAIYDFISSPGKNADAADTEVAGEDAMASWLEYFSPEKTAERILDFALSYFARGKLTTENGGTAEARQKFTDYITPAIQKGFDEAKRLLGVLPENIQEHIAKTKELIFEGLRHFIQNGPDPAKSSADGLYGQIEKYRARILAEAGVRAEAALALYNARGCFEAEAPISTVAAVG